MKQTLYIFILLGLLLVQTSFVQAQQKRALLVGISDYGNPRNNYPDRLWANISGANDVALLSPKFKKQGFVVSELTDERATFDNILKGLEQLIKSCKNGDVVYLHFSMHGQPVEDLNDDESDGWDEALIPVDAQKRYKKGVYEGKMHLTDDVLERYVTKIRTKIGEGGMFYVVLDACHSGESSRGDDEHVRGTNQAFSRSGKEYQPVRSRQTNDYFRMKSKAGQSAVMYLEACRAYQFNKELRDKATGKWFGPLSYYISQVMDTHNIGKSTKWVDAVKTKMDTYRPNKQNMVIESTITK